MQGRVWRAHRDDEAVSRHRHAAPAGRSWLLLALLCVQAVRYSRPGANGAGAAVGQHRWLLMAPLRRCWAAGGAGGWVSTNYAVLACRTIPHLPGQLVAAMEFADGFTVWRESWA